MLRHSSRGAVAALWFLTACARQAPPPPASVHAQDIFLPPQAQVIEAVVPPHATLDGLLRSYEFPTGMIEAAVRSAGSVFNLRQLRERQPYRLVKSIDGLLEEFEYQIDADRFLRIFAPDLTRPDVLDAKVVPYEKDTTVETVRGTIDAAHPSLIAAMIGAGENIQLAMALADIFSGQIDFDSDLQPGDRFELLFEKSSRDGQFAGYGPILGARFSADGREHEAFRWSNPETARAGYYDANGRSLKRFLLRTPLKFEPRITSGFSRNRLHPVFRTYRAHLGIDYAAPVGAPVVAVASGSRGVGRMGGRRRQPGSAPPRRRLRDLLPAPVRVRSRHPRRRARRSGAVDRPRRRDRHRHRTAPRLPPEAQRRVRQPARRCSARSRPAIRFRQR